MFAGGHDFVNRHLCAALLQRWSVWQTVSCNSYTDSLGDSDAVVSGVLPHNLLNSGDSICEQVIKYLIFM